ncbi:MAG: phosphate acyltransferase PlsX, partial [Gammaproteobacteria bacterium]
VTISLDAMGGDIGPDATVPAAIYSLKKYPSLRLILVGNEEVLRSAVSHHGGKLDDRLSIHPASDIVEMHDSPSLALRKKKDSSMRVAINLVKDGQADACVSAGNTGALMATARFVLKMLPGIDRPAIITQMPSMKDHFYMLDLGANVDSSAKHLRDFAVMGSVLASAVDNIENPSIALLNIGSEEIKGNDTVKEAARLLSETDLNYVGFAEGDEIYTGDVDIIVCDGFVGNVALKSSEGVAKFVRHVLKKEFTANVFTKLAAFVARGVLKSFARTFDPRRYNGASLLGLQGIVIKSHGGADPMAFSNAIKIAIFEVEKQVPKAISSKLQAIVDREEAAA